MMQIEKWILWGAFAILEESKIENGDEWLLKKRSDYFLKWKSCMKIRVYVFTSLLLNTKSFIYNETRLIK
jgi:hypothetical protein